MFIMSFNGIKANSDGTSLVQIKQDGYFPADLLFLSSTNPDGVCYIEVHIHLYFIYLFSQFNCKPNKYAWEKKKSFTDFR